MAKSFFGEWFEKAREKALGRIHIYPGRWVFSKDAPPAADEDDAQSRFTRPDAEFNGVRPAFVLMFLPLRAILGESANGWCHYLEALLQRSNVGSLNLNYHRPYEWRMSFASQGYYSSKFGLSAQPQGALKRRVGNSK